jgi:hypothetical protein
VTTVPGSGIAINQKFVWRLSAAQLAAELGAQAAMHRYHTRAPRNGATYFRVRLRMARERVWVVNRLPEAVLVAPGYKRALVRLADNPPYAAIMHRRVSAVDA